MTKWFYRYCITINILIIFHTNKHRIFHINIHDIFHTNILDIFHTNIHVIFHTNMHDIFRTNIHGKFHTNLHNIFHTNIHDIFHTIIFPNFQGPVGEQEIFPGGEHHNQEVRGDQEALSRRSRRPEISIKQCKRRHYYYFSWNVLSMQYLL